VQFELSGMFEGLRFEKVGPKLHRKSEIE